MASLATALPDEIARVSRLRDEFISLRGMPNVMVEPQITIMAAEIDRAVRALASGDVISIMRVYESLKGYKS